MKIIFQSFGIFYLVIFEVLFFSYNDKFWVPVRFQFSIVRRSQKKIPFVNKLISMIQMILFKIVRHYCQNNIVLVKLKKNCKFEAQILLGLYGEMLFARILADKRIEYFVVEFFLHYSWNELFQCSREKKRIVKLSPIRKFLLQHGRPFPK